jgi:arginase family enzyme
MSFHWIQISGLVRRFVDKWKNMNIFVRIGSAAVITVSVFGLAFIQYWYRNYVALHRLPGFTLPPETTSLTPDQPSKAHELLNRNDSNQSKEKSLEVDDTLQPKELQVRILNLDGALLFQTELIDKYRPQIVDATKWGPALRIDCTFGQFTRFEKELNSLFGTEVDCTEVDPKKGPLVTFYGSNDFHHITLALVRRIRQPVNFVIFDNHPDYCEYYFGLHCGCWLNHVIQLPTVKLAIHMGGNSGEFEDTWLRFNTPWKHMTNGKLIIFPADRKFTGMKWHKVPQKEMRYKWHILINKERVRRLLEPYADTLAKYPLYITIDKDVMTRQHCLQNWNSGVLFRQEIIVALEVLAEMSKGRILAIDITGDFTKVATQGWYRGYLHRTQHSDSENNIKQEEANAINQETNKCILKALHNIVNGLPVDSY